MPRRAALLFPGQAAQKIGMGRLAYARFPAARDVFDRVDGALGMPIAATCFDGPVERLQETSWQQPAIFACGMAIWSAWRETHEHDYEIVCAAGHSLGEFTALTAAGALTLEDGAALVALRGSLMQRAALAVPGGMCAVLGLDGPTVAEICAEATRDGQGLGEIVVLANDNAPGQQVISGGLAALERASAVARERGAKRVIPLKVAGAFHSPLMQPVVEEFSRAVQDAAITTCAFPVLANSTCAPLIEPESIRAEVIRQLTAPVRWVESIQALAASAVACWLDAGPGMVVAGMAERIVSGIETVSLTALIDVESET